MKKLVRDKIVSLIQAEGRVVDFKILTLEEFIVAAKKKLLEEAQEVNQASSPSETLAELADLQELIDCLLQAMNFTPEDLALAQASKNQAKGSFLKKLFVNKVS